MSLTWMPSGNRLVSACGGYRISLFIDRDYPEDVWRATCVTPGGGWLGDTPDVDGAKALCERDAQERVLTNQATGRQNQ
jgi:hypothetical protein